MKNHTTSAEVAACVDEARYELRCSPPCGDGFKTFRRRDATTRMSLLMSMVTQKAILAQNGEIVDAKDVEVNTLLAMKAGEVIPIDGIVVVGRCEALSSTYWPPGFKTQASPNGPQVSTRQASQNNGPQVSSRYALQNIAHWELPSAVALPPHGRGQTIDSSPPNECFPGGLP
ncbi:putative cadmium/zinc-transporting ATPase HMA4 [Platanthera guangdongensis]|uniref:Cadmium/zinc-transporting ATPase HMA4 n=1 Tax=Platanthera guangdongensis TaxID=2320717 RepID=A0ABR2N3E8_9ASPA